MKDFSAFLALELEEQLYFLLRTTISAHLVSELTYQIMKTYLLTNFSSYSHDTADTLTADSPKVYKLISTLSQAGTEANELLEKINQDPIYLTALTKLASNLNHKQCTKMTADIIQKEIDRLVYPRSNIKKIF